MGGGRAGRAIAGKRDPKSNEVFEGVFRNIFVNPRVDPAKPFSRADEASLNCRSFINTSTEVDILENTNGRYCEGSIAHVSGHQV